MFERGNKDLFCAEAGLSLVNILYVVQQSTVAPSQILFLFLLFFKTHTRIESLRPCLHLCTAVSVWARPTTASYIFHSFLSVFLSLWDSRFAALFANKAEGMRSEKPCLLNGDNKRSITYLI